MSKQPPLRAAGDPCLARAQQVPGSSPGSGGRAARAVFLHPPFLPPSGDSFFLHLPHQPRKSVRVDLSTGQVTQNVASPAQNEPVIGLEDRLLLTRFPKTSSFFKTYIHSIDPPPYFSGTCLQNKTKTN